MIHKDMNANGENKWGWAQEYTTLRGQRDVGETQKQAEKEQQ